MIAIANDHTSLELKKEIIGLLDEMGQAYRNFGTDSAEAFDYPVAAARAAKAVASGECELGIVLCGTGIGVGLTANKVRGVRCAMVSEPYSAAMARRHNDVNMISMGARVIGPELAKMIVREFLQARFEGGRHGRRVGQIMAVERGEEIE